MNSFSYSALWEFSNLPCQISIEEYIDGQQLLKLLQYTNTLFLPAPSEYKDMSSMMLAEMDTQVPRPKKSKKNTEETEKFKKLTLLEVLSLYFKNDWRKQGDSWVQTVTYTRSLKQLECGSFYGRLYSFKSAQTLKKEYRETLFHQHSTLDFENCHFRILLSFVKKYFPSLPHVKLENFVYKRDQYRKQLADACDMEHDSPLIKGFFCGLLFGMSIQGWMLKHDKNIPPNHLLFATGLSSEITTIRTKLAYACPILQQNVIDEHIDHTISVKNLSCILQTIESKLLVEVYKYLTNRGHRVVFLLHDGLEIVGQHEDNEELAIEASNELWYFHKYDMKLQWKKKTSIIDLDEIKEMKDDSYQGMKAEFEKTNFKVLDQNCYYTLSNNQYHATTTGQFRDKWNHLQYFNFTSNKKEQFIKKWMEDCTLRVYRNAAIYPNPTKCENDCFNLWTGFAIEKIELSEEEKIDPENLDTSDAMKYLLRRIVENDETYAFCTDLLAHMIQYPDILPRVSCTFQSCAQGIGKGSFGTGMETIIGKQYTFKTSKVESVFGQFNGLLQNKIFGILDEITITKNEYEQYKSIISEPTITIRNMHQTPVVVPSYLRIWSFLNQSKAISMIEESERRFLITGSDSTKIIEEDIPRFVKMQSNLKGLRLYYDYLRSIPINPNYSFEDHRPVSSLYNRLKVFHRSLELIFICDLLLEKMQSSGNFITPTRVNHIFHRSMKISHKSLFTRFVTYLSEHKYSYVCNSAAFTLRVESAFDDTTRRFITRKRSQANNRDVFMWTFSSVLDIMKYFHGKEYIDQSQWDDICLSERKYGSNEICQIEDL